MWKFDALCFFLVLLAAVSRATSNCCYVLQTGPTRQYGKNIAACLKDAAKLKHKNVEASVQVTDGCPFGKLESPISSVKIEKADTFKEDYAEITFEGGDYPFVNHNEHPIVLKNIRFKRSSGVAKILLGREVESGVNAPVEMSGCYFDEDVVIKLRHDVHFTATETMFGTYKSKEAVVSLAGVNQVVQFTRCILHTSVCHMIINGPLCGTLAIIDGQFNINTMSSRCSNAFVHLTKCAEYSGLSAELRIEGVKFGGKDAARMTTQPWINVMLFNELNPQVNLINNDYTDISVEKGMMYKFTQSLESVEYSLTAVSRSQVSSSSNLSWSENTDLATVQCLADFKNPDRVYSTQEYHNGGYTFLPTNQNSSSAPGGICYYCCGAVYHRGIIKGGNIGECAHIVDELPKGSQRVVHVLSDCPLGKPESTISHVAITTAYSYIKVITLEEGENPFAIENNGMLTFENIHFKKATGAGDGLAKMLVGLEVATGVNATSVGMIGCRFDKDVVLKLQHDVHFTATNTTFNQGSNESVFSLVGDVNQDVNLSGCVFYDMVCHTMITGPMCGKVTIKDTELHKVTKTSCTEAAVDLTICNTDVAEVPNLEIEGIKFEGEVANAGDAAWIKVEGSNGKVTEVTLINNDYRGLNDKELTQKGRIYRFHQVLVTRRVTLRNLRTTWDANTPLATHICPSNNNAPVLPIGGGLTGSKKLHQECSSLCCALKTPVDGESRVRFQGSSISECLQNLRGNKTLTIVEVFAECPLGDTIPVGKAEVVKSDTYAGDVEEALITGKSKEAYSLAISKGITFNNNIRFKTVLTDIAPPKIAVDSSEVGTDCACIQVLPEACYSSLWEAFDRLDQDRKQMSANDRKQVKTIRIEGVCISSRNGSDRELFGEVRIMKKQDTRGPTVVLFRSVAQLRVMESLYVGPGVVLQTPEKFDKKQSLSYRAGLRHVRIYVGRRTVKEEQMALLKLSQARVHGCIEILVEEAGRLKATETRFSGKPRISTSDRANKVTDSIRGNLPPEIKLLRSTFTREFEVKNPIESMIGIGCAIGTKVKMLRCSFPNTRIGAAVGYCYCAGKLDIQYSSFGIGESDGYSLVHVTACDKQTALQHHRGRVLLDGISFTDAENSEVASPRLGAITLNLYPAGPNVIVKDINYRGFQGRDGLAAVDSKPIFITMHSGYDGRLSNIVKKNYGDMSYEKNDFGGSLKCVIVLGNAKVTPILPILRKEENNEVVYRCGDDGTVFASKLVVKGKNGRVRSS